MFLKKRKKRSQKKGGGQEKRKKQGRAKRKKGKIMNGWKKYEDRNRKKSFKINN